jgi:hypothetical protein
MNDDSLSSTSNDQDAEALRHRATSAAPTTHRRARLPPELIDMIIAELCTDSAALASCALVCKSWVPASRHNLFSRITISQTNYSETSQILSSAIALAIKSLTIERITHFGVPHELFGRFSNVTQLTVCDTIVLDANTFSLPAWISLMQNLEMLALENVRIATPGTLRLLLTHSRRLKSLIFREVSFVDPLSDHNLQPLVVGQDTLVPELKLLMVCWSSRLLPWLVAHLRNAALRLTTLDLELEPFPPLNAHSFLESMLEVVGIRLRDFRLRPVLEETGECSSDAIHFHSHSLGAQCLSHPLCPWTARFAQSLGRLRQLESFSFQPYPLRGVNPNTLVMFVLHALRHLKSRHLQELTIVLVSAECNLLDHDIWSELGSILESLPILRALTLRVTKHPKVTAEAAAATEQWISELLPLCTARGILRFVWVD